jgi:cell division protein FtsB
MELANIEKLVEKYVNAETSLQEEATLKNYFAEGNMPPHLQEYESMFMYFETAKDETYTQTIQLEPKKSKRRNLQWITVAASVVLLLGVFVGKNKYGEYQERKEAEKIFAQVSNGFKLLSTNLKKGEQAVATLYTYENKINKILK